MLSAISLALACNAYFAKRPCEAVNGKIRVNIMRLPPKAQKEFRKRLGGHKVKFLSVYQARKIYSIVGNK